MYLRTIKRKNKNGTFVEYFQLARNRQNPETKKSGAKVMKTVIVDGENRAWEVPMILIKENKIAKDIIKKGTPIYKKGGSVKGKK